MKLTFKLNYKKDGLVVTGGEDIKGEVIIPSEQEYEGKTYPVTEIDGDAFRDCKALTSGAPSFLKERKTLILNGWD